MKQGKVLMLSSGGCNSFKAVESKGNLSKGDIIINNNGTLQKSLGDRKFYTLNQEECNVCIPLTQTKNTEQMFFNIEKKIEEKNPINIKDGIKVFIM